MYPRGQDWDTLSPWNTLGTWDTLGPWDMCGPWNTLGPRDTLGPWNNKYFHKTVILNQILSDKTKILSPLNSLQL